MTTYFVNSGAAGANNGTSWTNAYTTLAAGIVSKVDGDYMKVHYAHTETLGATVNLQLPGASKGVLIRSVDKDNSDAYRFGAKIVSAGFRLSFSAVWQGFDYDNSGSATSIPLANAIPAVYQSCTFRKQAGQTFQTLLTSGHATLDFIDCTFACGTSYTVAFIIGGLGAIRIIRPVFSGSKGTNADLFRMDTTALISSVYIEDADISAFDNLTDYGSTAAFGLMLGTMRRCTLPSSYEFDDGQTYIRKPGNYFRMIGCVAGTVSAPVYQTEEQQFWGYCKAQGTKYRNGGASDGTTPYAFEMVATANRTYKQSHLAARSIEMATWVAGGASITATVFIAHNAVGAGGSGALTNAECWVEWEGPSSAGSAVAVGSTATSMCALDGTPADLTTDGTSTWTGASIATHQKVVRTYTPTIAGQLIAKLYFAPENASDKTIYVDPLIVVT